MPKPTPNPPESSPQNDSANSASNLGLDSSDLKTSSPKTMYSITPGIDTESLLASACETLASASVMASDFSVFVNGPQRRMVLGIQQLIMLADLAVNRALDNIDPQS
ncbi:DUF6124 family protein [Pseudomonas sp. ZT5P21]